MEGAQEIANGFAQAYPEYEAMAEDLPQFLCSNDAWSRGRTKKRYAILRVAWFAYSLAKLEWVADIAGEFDPDGLQLGVLLEGLEPVLPADATLLITTEGRVEGESPVGVNPDRAGLKGMGYPVARCRSFVQTPAAKP